ncbi:MAG TPA: hypothetical protein VHW09_33100 [Bryobacteraceae bacterium]|jgi:proteasome lid subunit RPN8/RPN11|nr:hypothetical protein [Bryobacteraceae bacterium]
MEHSAEIALGKWSAPECPFAIEYSARVLDDIRLAVVDAFFSLPRGGAEIGGVLLGQRTEDRVAITAFEPLDCEHAMGPSFTLSARDQTRLAEMIAAARRNPPERQPVGWYHSHTRSEIFLTEADQALHNRFFPETWQVALVLKPHTFEPTRAGFFFREPDNSIRCQASYQEFHLHAMPLRSTAGPGGGNSPGQRPSREDAGVRGTPAETLDAVIPEPPKRKAGVPITREIPVEAGAGHENGNLAAAAEPAAQDGPTFGEIAPQRPWRIVKPLAILAVGIVVGGAGYQTRASWLPAVSAKLRAVLPHEPVPYLSLAVKDDRGELRIQWDRNSPAVRNALEATLQIIDGKAALQSVRLDGAHLASGGFTYVRQSDRVDVTLLASEPGGQIVKEQTSFLGRLPGEKGVAQDPQAVQTGDTEAQKADKLQKDLNFQAAKTRKLEKDLKAMQDEMDKNKTPDAAKKND